MRNPQEIEARIQTEKQEYNNDLLARGSKLTLNQLALEISSAYEAAFLSALRHRPNGILVDKLATITWLAGSDLNVAEVPWLQYGMPRIRQMAKELKLPFPLVASGAPYLRAKRMSNGLPCIERCVRCFSIE